MALLHVGVGDCPAHPSPPASSLALRPSCSSLTRPSASFASALLPGLSLQVYRLKLGIFEALHLPGFLLREKSLPWVCNVGGWSTQALQSSGARGGPGSSRGEGAAATALSSPPGLSLHISDSPKVRGEE